MASPSSFRRLFGTTLGLAALGGLLSNHWMAAAHADTVALAPVADTTLFERDPDNNWGSEAELVAGSLGSAGGGSRCRLLSMFDIAGNIPAGSTIHSASLRMEVLETPSGGGANSNFGIFRVLVPWVEGDKDTGDARPGGAPASPGETTWQSRLHNTANGEWAAPGGKLEVDFAEDPSAGAFVSGQGAYLFDFDEAGIQDLQIMLDFPDFNFGWVVMTEDETQLKSARRWASREHPSEAPTLTVDFTPPGQPAEAPEITSFLLDDLTDTIVIRFLALSGRVYYLETGNDLSTWAQVQSSAPISDSELTFSEPTGGSTRMFYRIVSEFPAP